MDRCLARAFYAVITLVASLAANEAWATTSFGRTAGQFGVSPVGTAQYSIPIWTPPGPRGIQPQIALTYSSGSGIGSLGVDWSVGGLGAVTRCNKTYAQDTTPAPVALVTTDGYCLNGNRLRLTSGTYGTAGSTYQTEIADFSNTTANGTAGNGPEYFTVQGRDGLTYQYGYVDSNGNGANSEVLATSSTTADTWLLSKIIDRSGNNLVINYTTLTGTAVPNTILWTPTSTGASSYTYTMTFNYSSNVPQSSLTKYIGGTAVTNSKLLSSISIAASGTVIKDYFLGYQASPTTGRDELLTVTECADSAQSNCLLPTTIGYQNGIAGVSTSATTAVSSSGTNLTAKYDLNGDGFADLIYNPTGNGVWYVAFGSAAGYGTPLNTGITGNALFGNFTGGEEDGLLVNHSGTWWYYTWNGSSFVGASTGVVVDSASEGFQLADIDGDGLPDLIDLNLTLNGNGKYTATILTRLNTSKSGSASLSSTVSTAYTLGALAGSAQLMTPDNQYGTLRRYDFDGDGRDDLVLSVLTGTSPSYTLKTYELISAGTTYSGTLIASISAVAYIPVFFTKWNDDACTDFVTDRYLYISGCNGTTASATLLSGTVLGAMDWDGDGRTDLIVANGSTIGVYLSTGAAVGSLLSTSIPYTSTCQYVTLDANGDGLDDLGCWSQTGSSPLTYYLHNGAGLRADLAISFKDGYGLTQSPSYTPMTAAGVYTKGTSAVFPYVDYIGPTYVASSYSSSDGIGSTFTETYSYSGAVINLQGRGFQAFGKVRSLDSRTSFYDNQYFYTSFPSAQMLSSHIVTQSSASKYVRNATYTETAETLDSTANNERYFPYYSTVKDQMYELGGTLDAQLITTAITTRSTPDAYGNFATVATSTTDNDPNSPYVYDVWSTSAAYTISPDHGINWCLNLPSEIDVTNTAPPGSGSQYVITRHTSFVSPDYANCRETEQVVESGNSTYQVDTKIVYDGFGNVNSQTVTGVGMTARVTSATYGTTGQFPATQTNALNQQSQMGFDPNSGQLSSVKDPNGIQTSWTYDPFQRQNRETRPDGTSTTWAYNNCATAGCVNANNQMTVVQTNLNSDNTTLNVQNTYLDQRARTLVTSKQMLTGAYDRNEVQYDNLGNVHQQLAPCTFVSCVSYSIVNTFDSLHRLTQSQRPISATNNTLQTTTVAYAGRTTTTTDPQSKVTTTITKVTGTLGRTKDHNGYYVNFNHDAFGAVLSVTDSLSNTLSTSTYDYGVGAFKRTLADMDFGSRSWTYDALGEVTAYSDGKNQSFSAKFDALSRPTSRTEPDLTTTWTWGSTAASYNIGKLASLSSSASAGTYSESYGFDSAGRLSSEIISIPGGGSSNRYDYGYSSTTGLLNTMTFPASYPTSYRLAAFYSYSYGIPSSIQDANVLSTVWWTNNTMNPRGQITKETTEDLSGDPKIVSNRAYDAVTGWLSTSQTGVGTGAALQNESYLYDEMGNVTERQNNNAGLTENIYYDNLYRLDHSTLGGSTNLQMSYDAMGDITSRSDVASGATWTYDPTHKHQVTQAGSTSFTYTYDANGNAITRNGTMIGWTSYNYASSVGTSSESATFDYGPNHQRWRMIYNGSAGQETTYYATPMFEEVFTSAGTDYRHYIYAGIRPVVVISRTTAGAVTVHSLLLDQQGSIATVVADSTGTSAANESFTAYGSRREASTWTGTPTTAELNAMNGVTREGYTFQTVLGSMGLNHMNARIEDSVTGRFLSPDTKVSDRTFSQDYNRYSYVNNNPLSYTDPTGHNPFRHCTDWCTTTGTGRKVYFNRYENSFFDGDPPGFAAAGPGLGLAWANMSSSGDDDLDDLTDSLNTLAAQLINDALNFVAGNDASGLLADAIQAQDAGTAQSQQTSNSTGNGGAVGAFVGPAATAVEGATLAEIVVIAASTAAGVLLPDATSSSDTTSNNSNVPVYRVVDPTELAYLLAHGNYGSSPNQSGKYFALTAAGAQAFLNAPMNSNGTLTMTTLPGAVLSQGYAFPDPGVFGAGPSVFFSNPQLPLVYGTMAPPVVIPSVPGN